MQTQVRDLTVGCDTANLQQVRAFVGDTVRESRLTDREQSLLVLAADEVLTSIIRHAHRTSVNGMCRVTVDVDDVRVRILVDETGDEVDLARFSESELARRVEQTRQDEIGIFLIRAIVDEINYVYRRGFQNRLELTKFVYSPHSRG